MGPRSVGGKGGVMGKYTPGYEVTTDGRVFSVSSNWRGYGIREMRASLNSDGYPSVRITIDGVRKRYTVHKLVALYHLPPKPSEDCEVRHLDGNKLNPKACNLAWGTKKENAADRDRHGRTYHMTTHEARARAEKSSRVKNARARAAIAKAEGRE